MSWHTTGPGGLRYQFGNVLALAKHSGLGHLTVVPRVGASDTDGDYLELDDLELLASLQQAVEDQDLPWRHVEFSSDDPDGQRITVGADDDVTELLADLAALVRDHRESVMIAIASADDNNDDSDDDNDDDADEHSAIAGLAVSIDAAWTLDAADYPALIAWLNEPFDEPLITDELLRQGTIDDGYEPPSSLDEPLEHWAKARDSRHLGVHALAHALLSDEPLSLDQPDDETQVIAWSKGDGLLNAVLFRPADVPLLDILARAFDVPAPVRQSIYYLHFIDVEVELPDEPDLSPDAEAAGMAFSEYLAQMFPFLPSLDIGESDDDEHSCIHGFHPSASLDEMSEAFSTARLRPVTMAQFLRRPPGEPLAAIAQHRDGLDEDDYDDANDIACFDYLLDGGDVPEAVSPSVVAALIYLVDSPDSLGDAAARLEQLLAIGARSSDE